MRGLLIRVREVAQGDSGLALMTVIMAGAVMTAVAVMAAGISLNNLKNAGRDRVAGGAMGAAEAGLAEGINFLRTHPAGSLSCSPTCGATNPWGDQATAQSFTFPDGRTAKVWIEVVQAFNPPAFKVATFKIHSTGTSGTGPGTRVLEQTVSGKPLDIPIGVYANEITMNGTPQTFQESVFSKNCITGRDKMNFGSQPDAYFGITPAAHSTQYISTGNSACNAGVNNNIHKASACNSSYPYDQDALGGPVSSPCNPPGGTSKFTQADLDNYGRGLTDNELAWLRTRAQSMGQYWTSPTGWTPPNPTTYPNAVIFFDVGPNDTVTIQNELDPYFWDGSCATAPRTVIIVVNNSSVGSGGVTVNSNGNLAGALFVQRGQLKFNGTITWTGTLFANTIQQWNGNATSQLTQCFLLNMPLLNITPTRFREVDR